MVLESFLGIVKSVVECFISSYLQVQCMTLGLAQKDA